MALARVLSVLSVLSVLMATSVGCRAPSAKLAQTPRAQPPAASSSATAHLRPQVTRENSEQVLRPASLASLETETETESSSASDGDDPFAGDEELLLADLVSAVKARNPSLQSAYAAWNAAANKYPQVVALDDPMFQSMYAPVTWGSASDVQSSYYFGVAQKIPWSGKRELRGNQANWEAIAASFDASEAELRITEAARVAFFDYYLNQRERELNAANREALRGFRDIARAKFEGNQVTQQDVLQADVELAELEQQQIGLAQEKAIVIARINTLLHRRPDHPLPIPPVNLQEVSALPPVDRLREWAVEHRPELQAMAARVQAEQSAVALACKEYYPDFELMGRYDRFWTDQEQQPQIGLNANIPLNHAKRHAAVQEALWRVHKMQAEYNQAADNIRGEVQSSYARVRGSQQKIQVFESKILPAAEGNLSSAQAGYEAGTVDFLRLIEAQRQILELREKHQMALADLHRRLAELDRVVGKEVLEGTSPAPVPPADVPPEPARRE